MSIEAHSPDLHSGFNLKRHILEVVGKSSDLVLSHPPYHNAAELKGLYPKCSGSHPTKSR